MASNDGASLSILFNPKKHVRTFVLPRLALELKRPSTPTPHSTKPSNMFFLSLQPQLNIINQHRGWAYEQFVRTHES